MPISVPDHPELPLFCHFPAGVGSPHVALGARHDWIATCAPPCPLDAARVHLQSSRAERERGDAVQVASPASRGRRGRLEIFDHLATQGFRILKGPKWLSLSSNERSGIILLE